MAVIYSLSTFLTNICTSPFCHTNIVSSADTKIHYDNIVNRPFTLDQLEVVWQAAVAGTSTIERRDAADGICMVWLHALLAKTEFDNRTDHIIFTGDLVSKGPASSAVVDFAIEQNASCVRGNHEDRILLAHRDLEIHRTSLPGLAESSDARPLESGDPGFDKLDEESFAHGDYVDRQFAKSLTPEQVSYLASCPLILDISEIPSLGHAVVAHAGLIAGVGLENQDPMGVMNMRTVDLKTHVPSRAHSGTPWYRLWNKHQSILPARNRSTVIYAHDSKSGLQMNPYSKGINTGCAGGGKLTALVMTMESQEEVEEEVVSVRCKDYRKPRGKWRGWADVPFMMIEDDTHGGTGSGQFKT
ncbi:MAG: hypothetical protein Q9211_001989 [Gyalolechia sp. 1 TL-2023]